MTFTFVMQYSRLPPLPLKGGHHARTKKTRKKGRFSRTGDVTRVQWKGYQNCRNFGKRVYFSTASIRVLGYIFY